MKNISCLLLMISTLVAACSSCAFAVDLQAGALILYPEKEVVRDDILAAGQQVTIEPKVEGDVTAAGQSVIVSGPVKDSILLLGQTVVASGGVGNDAWMAGNTVKLDGSVTDNAYLAGSTVIVSSGASIGTDLLAAGAVVNIMGDVGRNARVAGNTVTVAGTIGGSLYVQSDGLVSVMDGAVIKGNFYYESPLPAQISNGAKILGDIKHSIPKKEKVQAMGWPAWLGWAPGIVAFIAAIIFGCVLLSLFPARAQEAANTARGSFWLSVGIGILLLIVTPIACLIAAPTLVGFPLALAVAFVYIILVYSAKVFAGFALGQWILGAGRQTLPKPVGSMILGLIIIAVAHYLLGLIPVAGCFVQALFKLVVWIVGLGAFLVSWWRSRQPAREQ